MSAVIAGISKGLSWCRPAISALSPDHWADQKGGGQSVRGKTNFMRMAIRLETVLGVPTVRAFGELSREGACNKGPRREGEGAKAPFHGGSLHEGFPPSPSCLSPQPLWLRPAGPLFNPSLPRPLVLERALYLLSIYIAIYLYMCIYICLLPGHLPTFFVVWKQKHA